MTQPVGHGWAPSLSQPRRRDRDTVIGNWFGDFGPSASDTGPGTDIPPPSQKHERGWKRAGSQTHGACQGQHTSFQNNPCPARLRPERRVPVGTTHAGREDRQLRGGQRSSARRKGHPVRIPQPGLGTGPGADDTGLEESTSQPVPWPGPGRAPGMWTERPDPDIPFSHTQGKILRRGSV